MTDAHFILTLGKVLIAAAWIDGEVNNVEVNCLKDLLFQLPGLTGREWATLEMYIDAPVGDSERARLVEQLGAAVRTAADREQAIEFIQRLAAADGEVTGDEAEALETIERELHDLRLGLLGQLGRVMGGALERRQAVLQETPNREDHFEDYIKNKVYYGLHRRSEEGGQALDIPEARLRKLCLAGGLMARVAHVDRKIKQEERSAMIAALQTGWDLTADEAGIVAEVALDEIGPDMDYYRLTRQFFTTTEERERSRFLEVLFSIAAADGTLSHEETEEIRTIANTLRLSHKQFIQAKLTLPEALRGS